MSDMSLMQAEADALVAMEKRWSPLRYGSLKDKMGRMDAAMGVLVRRQ